MRSKFPGYFRPTKAEFDDIWKRGLVVPDTNILLHLLRFRGSTRDDIIKTLNAFKAQLWIPHQVAFEFSRSWSKIDHDHRASYQALKKQIETIGDALTQLLENVGRYQIIDARSEKAKVDKLVKDLCKSVDESSKNHPPLEEAEKTVETIISLFDGSIGSEPTSEQMKDWLAEAQERYSNKIPPGYKDDKKEVGDRYSDYIIWRELLGIAKQRNLPVLFLTDDRKEDWVATRNGQYLGPRPELLQEFRAETDQRYYSYQLTAFLERAKEYMKVEVSKDTIKDVATGTAKQVEQTAKPNKADDKKDLPTEVIAPIDTSQSNLGKPTTIEFEGSSKPNEVDPKENNS